MDMLHTVVILKHPVALLVNTPRQRSHSGLTPLNMFMSKNISGSLTRKEMVLFMMHSTHFI